MAQLSQYRSPNQFFSLILLTGALKYHYGSILFIAFYIFYILICFGVINKPHPIVLIVVSSGWGDTLVFGENSMV